MSIDHEPSTGHGAAGDNLPVRTGTGTAEDPYFFPLGEHEHRRTDIDARAAKRAERQVAGLFAASALFTLLALISYIAIPVDAEFPTPLGTFNQLNFFLGLTFGLAVFCIGAGAIHWARKLMPDVEVTQQRHELKSTQEDREQAIEAFEEGAEASGFVSRPLIRRTLLGALTLFPLPIIFVLRDLYWRPGPEGKSPEDLLATTLWEKDVHIVTDPTRRKIKPEDLTVGSLVSAVPETLAEVEEAEGTLNARAKAAIILIRMDPGEIRSEQGPSEGPDMWSYQGILAFSKICTHAGCAIALYEHRTHHLLCPCHQSTFDLADAGKVIFGPAGRSMPQLAVSVDAEGYLVARGDFASPVGPSFWELG